MWKFLLKLDRKENTKKDYLKGHQGHEGIYILLYTIP